MQTQEKGTYNGWSNYETWCVNLWLTSEPGTSEYLTQIATQERMEDRQRGDDLKSFVEEMMPHNGASLASDLLTSALSQVDWQEIIEYCKNGNK